MPTKDRLVANQIEKLLATLLTASFGYCGVAKAENFTLLNSGDAIKIKIEIGPSAEETAAA
jgi:hypothetical protein